jgi:hypothetical protein
MKSSLDVTPYQNLVLAEVNAAQFAPPSVEDQRPPPLTAASILVRSTLPVSPNQFLVLEEYGNDFTEQDPA